MIILGCLLLSTIIVFVWFKSGILESIKWLISRVLHTSPSMVKIPKPFSCELCMTFWCNIIYLIVMGNFTLPYILVACLISWLSGAIDLTYDIIRDSIVYVLNKIYNLF